MLIGRIESHAADLLEDLLEPFVSQVIKRQLVGVGRCETRITRRNDDGAGIRKRFESKLKSSRKPPILA